ncbi:uncharacterized protein LOC116257292 [Nymphaea colorata]|uniref:uncharacterized protein LOC116257292 n=1 Tax=Nymphaea colorata TaxID=210225 RepID=UPI00129EAB54|nr:uncharacterized protein LOC116257292 [Nymphaea colorata]
MRFMKEWCCLSEVCDWVPSWGNPRVQVHILESFEHLESTPFTMLQKGLFLILASSKGALVEILLPIKWKVHDMYLVISKWESGKPMKMKAASSVPIWDCLPDMHILAGEIQRSECLRSLRDISLALAEMPARGDLTGSRRFLNS